ncbi:aldehyde dehydrogenase [Aidingimonas halophila]|uniref:Gamma-glutamyl-gamma-aminobutyraldehyde dehydrogenase n=1 Tax=Aidingimonas halophila TaxID=574349 RepID=A0A1H3DGX9_9GAMM|nr:aldehyde dehydrogenase [Aidingimonas halophila]GHC29857.1 aldehyde dehydrogenase [Aidingimonas halophila]SDX65713.1 gamma-glutamyl-gamma-aminobutyraldehyde dehydrogenase [Aidingimonas halophila]
MTLTYADWQQRAADLSLNGSAYIDSRRVASRQGEWLESINPMTGETLTTIAACGIEEIDNAVAVARRTFDTGAWSRAEPTTRRQTLQAIAAAIRDNAEELALLDSLEVGKCIHEALDDVEESALLFDWFGEVQDKCYDQLAPSPSHVQATVVHEPLGVVGAVVPWNFPLHNASVKLAPALAAGNSVVLKPAEESSLSALRLAELATQAGLPHGVLNVVPGYGHIAGEALGRHHDVDALGFTGSTEIGKRFLIYSGESNMKPVWLECGGKSPHLIFDDCPDLDTAVDNAVAGIFTNAGQVCSAHSRLLLQEGIADRFLDALQARISTLVAGDPLDPATMLGPLVSQAQFDKVCEYLAIGKREATLLCGGDTRQIADGRLFVSPTVFTEVASHHRIFQEEIFGPVLTVTRFDEESEGVTLANESQYGLAASLWTSDLGRAHRLCDAIQAGTVTVNGVDAVSPQTPFGGMKQSGIGRDYALTGMHKYMALKTRWIHY